MKRVFRIYIFSLALLALQPLSAVAAEPISMVDDTEQAESDVSSLESSPFIAKGEIFLGLTASYGTSSSTNSTLLYLISGIDASLSYGSIDPFMGYFYRDNRCVGVRLGYSTIAGAIDSGALDFGELNDIEIDIPYVDLNSSSFNYSIFHRSYLPLDKRGNFGIFAEVELMACDGTSTMSFDTGGELQRVRNKNFQMNLGFNPGIVVFVLENVSTNVSFGMGGLGYTTVKQFDAEGNVSGTRSTSQLCFKFNIIDINFGVTIHL